MAHAVKHSTEVAPQIHLIQVPIPYPFKYVNCYLLKGEGAVLVDCALDTPEARPGLEAALAEHGLSFADLDQVVLTHHHPDHYGLCGLIEAYGPKVGMLDLEKERGHIFWTQDQRMMREGMALFARHGVTGEVLQGLEEEMRATRQRVHPAQNPQTFHDGETLQLAGMSFRVIWTPGHADGHAMFLRESDGVLLAGDQILERISPNIGIWAYSFPNPLALYLESLEKTTRLGAKVAFTGHYGPIQDIPGRCRELAQHHQERLAHLRGLMGGEAKTAWALSLELFPGNLNLAQRRFAWSETLAHLEYLVAEGSAQHLEGQPVRYTL
ncbi:MAG: MBL fold metallo-hydrolase [Thermaceae bacterium]|nr:MBL fold metallo-hydrolase [Thermaceae bacterium]